MAINRQAISSYVEQNTLPLIKKAVLGAETTKYFNLMPGLTPGQTALNYLNTAIEFKDGSNCSWSPAGDDTFTQRTISTSLIEINKSYCEKALLDSWMGHMVKVGSGAKNLPFEEDFIQGAVNGVAAALEKMLWQGDKSSSDKNLKLIDGVIKIAEAATLAGTVNYTTNDTKLGVMKNVVKALPYEVYEMGNAVAYVGNDFYDDLVQEMIANGNIVINAGADYASIGRPASLMVPGTRVEVRPVNGLNGTGKVFASFADNFIYGTSLDADKERVEFWYSQDHREFRLDIEFVAGVQLVFPELVVEAKI